KLWGRCAKEVEIAAEGSSSLTIGEGADGTEVHDLAMTGAGFVQTASTSIVLEQVWIHDTSGRGIDAQAILGPADLTVSNSLVENAPDFGVLICGGSMTVDRSVIRGTRSRPNDLKSGRGLSAVASFDTAAIPKLVVNGSIIEGNRDIGVFASAGDVTLVASL